MIIVVVLAFHVVITFWYPSKHKNQNYYLVKDLINCWFLFFCIPLAIVWKNEKMFHYVRNSIKNSDIVNFVRTLFYLMADLDNGLRPRTNKIFSIELEP